jgi:hypothetical protein
LNPLNSLSTSRDCKNEAVVKALDSSAQLFSYFAMFLEAFKNLFKISSFNSSVSIFLVIGFKIENGKFVSTDFFGSQGEFDIKTKEHCENVFKCVNSATLRCLKILTKKLFKVQTNEDGSALLK